ncbi:hypothetical protein ACXDF8_02160 [Mycolicibacterium sp. CBM1]
MTDLWRRIPRPVLIRIAYLIVGVKLGALWLAQGDSSPWQHALRLIVLMAAVMAVTTVVRKWAARRGRHVAHHPIGRFLLAKFAIVALAVAAGLGLESAIANADLWVAVGLAAVVAVAGPLIHPWLVKADTPEHRRAPEPAVAAA